MQDIKVALVNDLPLSGATNPGQGSGAELSSGSFVREGIQRGYYVDAIWPDMFNPAVLQEYDLIVTKNVKRFSEEQVRAIMAQDYVAWPSDYSFTRWRLYFAFQDYMRELPNNPFWEEFYTSSVFNTFLSPLHKEAYEWVLDGVGEHPHHLSPPSVNEEEFHPDEEGWEPGTVVSVNGLLPFKGLQNHVEFVEEHPEARFYFVGGVRDRGVLERLPENCEYMGRLPQRQLVDVLGKAETYLSLPGSCQPFNRTAVEGLLSCKQVVTNKLVGATSYDWYGDPDDARAAVREAPAPFWDRIEKEMNW